MIISNEITNLPPDIVFDHCSSIVHVFLLFSPPSIQFKLIRNQNNLQFQPRQYARYTVFPLVFLRNNCLMVNQLWAVRHFFYFFVSPQLIAITVIIEAFYLDKLVTEKGESVLLIFFKKNFWQFSISDWLKSQGKFLITSQH